MAQVCGARCPIGKGITCELQPHAAEEDHANFHDGKVTWGVGLGSVHHEPLPTEPRLPDVTSSHKMRIAKMNDAKEQLAHANDSLAKSLGIDERGQRILQAREEALEAMRRWVRVGYGARDASLYEAAYALAEAEKSP